MAYSFVFHFEVAAERSWAQTQHELYSKFQVNLAQNQQANKQKIT